MPTAAAVATASFKSLMEGLGKLATAKPYAENAALVTDLMEKVSSMYGEYEAVTESQAALKAELASFKNFEAQKPDYVRTTEDSGVVTYKLKAPEEPSEEAIRFCPNCFLNCKVSYLQPNGETVRAAGRNGRWRVHDCKSCNSTYPYNFLQDRPMPQPFSGGLA
ncbi:MAG: hypothetical protein KF779_14235 [Hyphomonadaceae bacterium]|nr:hypothetical protein [Hyphomonadaceae bacterium]